MGFRYGRAVGDAVIEVAFHRIGLARTSLAVGKDSAVVALHDFLENRTYYFVVYVILSRLGSEDSVEVVGAGERRCAGYFDVLAIDRRYYDGGCSLRRTSCQNITKQRED